MFEILITIPLVFKAPETQTERDKLCREYVQTLLHQTIYDASDRKDLNRIIDNLIKDGQLKLECKFISPKRGIGI